MKLVRESINESMSEAAEFNGLMSELEDQLDNANWEKFEKESGEFWREIGAETWEEAFRKDTMGCYAFKEQIQNMLK